MAALVFFTVIIKSTICLASFSVGSTQLPRSTHMMAIGYDEYSDAILLLGGDYLSQITTFKNNQFTYDPFFFKNNLYPWGEGQFYTQVATTLWMIEYNGDSFISFDTTTNQAIYPSIIIPNNVKNGACLTSIYNYLIVVGGGDYSTQMNKVQIYDLTSDSWLSNVPSLNTKRTALSCVVLNDKVYAIGGYNNDDDELDTIEVLTAQWSDISTATWSDFSCTLDAARDGLRAVVYGTNLIYVVGGYDAFEAHLTVDIIDTEQEECQVGPPLNYGTVFSSAIIVKNTLFVFGGTNKDLNEEDRYQYLTLPTLNPTSAPTNHPTSSPLRKATSNPTMNPVADPTMPPTQNPVMDPSSAPQHIPTIAPTRVPSADPTKSPSNHPTTNKPTLFPVTAVPTFTALVSTHTLNTNINEEEVPSSYVTTLVSSGEQETMETETNLILLALTLFAGGICIGCAVLLVVFLCRQKGKNTNAIEHMRNSIDHQDVAQSVVSPAVDLAHSDVKKKVEMTKINDVDTEAQKGEDMLGNLNVDIVSGVVADDDYNDDSSAEILEAAPTDFGGTHDDYEDDEGEDEDEDAEILDAIQKTIGMNDMDECVVCEDSDGDNEAICTDGDAARGNDVKLWLDSIGCRQYFDKFMMNGFESMDFVQEINDLQDLDAIGITSKKHQLEILNNIKKLKQ